METRSPSGVIPYSLPFSGNMECVLSDPLLPPLSRLTLHLHQHKSQLTQVVTLIITVCRLTSKHSGYLRISKEAYKHWYACKIESHGQLYEPTGKSQILSRRQEQVLKWLESNLQIRCWKTSITSAFWLQKISESSPYQHSIWPLQ